ncbi:hypothetical protein [Streptomyces atratus]|uniref:hypothetical protein n=1 Tax=Streptomyces atratus TaxID=1893 RepID=UPI002255ECD4|nr:hypothetical protein [Streptomyces atratus]MCX5345264.1 hypothetical protein [Streptomyces atratus]
MASGIEDRDGHVATLEVTPVGAGVQVRGVAPSGELAVICTPARARELAAALALAADEAESAQSADPVTVKARELRRGDVRDGDRAMTVEGVRIDGTTAHVTWKSGAGRSWTQGYGVDADITLRRRG